MPLTDPQLRQELLKYRETVPPITQLNRAQLHARLQVLKAQPQPRSPIKSPPARSRSPPSPARSSARSSRPTRGLIQLSDSEADTSPTRDYTGRRTNAQTRSVAVGRDTEHTPSANLTSDVEQSLARHRREIQQLIDSARERTRIANASISSGQYEPPASTPLRPTSTSSRSYQQQPARSTTKKFQQPSWLNRSKQAIVSFWKVYKNVITSILKCLLFGAILGIALVVLTKKGGELIPHRKGITCTQENATECDEMIPVIDSLKRFLQIRTGEVDCGYRPKKDRFVEKREIDKYLDNKGFKFEKGSEERWNTLISYIVGKPVDEIIVLTKDDQQTNIVDKALKISATEGVHSMLCRAQKTVHSAMHHLAWLLLGTASLLGLGWFFKRRSKQHEESENTYKDFVEKITNLLEDQYQEHLHDPETKPWLAISHIRDMLIPPQDRKRLKTLWERAQKQISQNESRVRAESQLIHGEEFDVWRWIQPRSTSSPSPTRKRAESPQSSNEESYVYMPPDVGLTECLKLRSFFDPDTAADDDEIDLVVDNIQNRCATVRRIQHIGILASYVYLKFSSKEAAAQGFHLLNNWKYHGRDIVAKYLRLERYHQHFPEAIDSNSTNN